MEIYKSLNPGCAHDWECGECPILCNARQDYLGAREPEGSSWTPTGEELPRYYHEVMVKRGEAMFMAWLSTGSESDGLYWNLVSNGHLIEVEPRDEWR